MAKKLVAQDVLDYEVAVGALAKAKKVEIELRNKIVGAFRYTKSEGVEHKSVEGLDIDIAITLGLNRKVDQNALEAIWDTLNESQQEAIKWKAEVVSSKFKKLVEDEEIGELLNLITEKPSQASVKLKYEE
jgi:hypothetical protein